MRFRAFLPCVLALGLGCSSALTTDRETTITPVDLLGGRVLGGGPHPDTLVASQEVLALSAEMLEFLDTNIHPKAVDGVRLQELIDAIINAGDFNLEFDGETRTAAETFRLRRGNCLSFSNMFVAMARHINLDASFQEVDIPPEWSFKNDFFILNRHVNVAIDMGSLGIHVVDFNIDDFKSSYDSRTISDSRARAHYFNNMGVESMQKEDTAAALGYFRRAIEESDSDFSPAWTNLGTLYMRLGHPSYAEATYLYALRVDDGDLVAMSNLARFYERQGDSERAIRYRKKVKNHRRKNPYYRYQRARDAYSAADYNTAIKHLKFAIREKKNEDQFYFLLGMCYLQRGNQQAAERWLSKAEQVASTDALKSKYSSKLDLLQSENRRP